MTPEFVNKIDKFLDENTIVLFAEIRSCLLLIVYRQSLYEMYQWIKRRIIVSVRFAEKEISEKSLFCSRELEKRDSGAAGAQSAEGREHLLKKTHQ